MQINLSKTEHKKFLNLLKTKDINILIAGIFLDFVQNDKHLFNGKCIHTLNIEKAYCDFLIKHENIDNKTAETILDEFFKASFEGGRHERRVKKIAILK